MTLDSQTSALVKHLRAVMRARPGDGAALREAIVAAMDLKPERHHFDLHGEPEIVRFMNTTGG